MAITSQVHIHAQSQNMSVSSSGHIEHYTNKLVGDDDCLQENVVNDTSHCGKVKLSDGLSVHYPPPIALER